MRADPATPGSIDTHRVYPLKDDPNNPGQRVLDTSTKQ